MSDSDTTEATNTKLQNGDWVTYTKLRNGDWGLRGPAACLSTGGMVEVVKRSGETKLETVGRILWSNDTLAIATIGHQTYTPRATPAPRTRRARREPEYCGYPCPVSRRRCTPANGPCHDCE